MTGDQSRKLQLLSGCTFRVGSFDKRFVRNLSGYEGELTEKQARCLEQIFHRYRRQIKGHSRICKVCSGEIPEAKRSITTPSMEEREKLEKWNSLARND